MHYDDVQRPLRAIQAKHRCSAWDDLNPIVVLDWTEMGQEGLIVMVVSPIGAHYVYHRQIHVVPVYPVFLLENVDEDRAHRVPRRASLLQNEAGL